MKFSKMKPQPSKELKIPDLAGGINLRDGLSAVLDNQLTDSLNMWFQDGVLKTRPGINCVAQATTKGESTAPQTIKSQEIKRHNCFKTDILGERMQLCSTITVGDYTDGYHTWINFFWYGKERTETLPAINIVSHVGGIDSYFVVKHNEVLYCYTSNYEIYKLESGRAVWELVKEKEYYVPIVYYHCKNKTIDIFELDFESTGETIKNVQSVTFEGTQLEGYNLLGNYYQMVYSTYSEEIETNLMVFNLGCKLPDSTAMADDEQYVIKAEYINKSGEKYTHKAVWEKGDIYSWETDEEAALQGDNLRMYVDGVFNRIVFYAKGTGNYMNIAEETIYIEDNLTITAPCIFSESEKKKVFLMTETEWFGGSADGLSGGTRLFLGGNSDSNEKALVCWSGLNNPLYFPENSYFYVGDEAEKVTGFGKQSDMIVIFKENEIWYSRYNQNTDITASDLINQTVVDYTASSVYFTLTSINSTIGCSNADTIQLCRNRLVWLGNDNKVYTLVTDNQYNERTVFCVSEMIDRSLRENNLRKASSCDWEGYYCLSFGEKVFLMDYNCYGYTHITSYSKGEDANIHIPWYYWEFPSINADELTMLSLSNNMLFAQYRNIEAGTVGTVSVFNADMDRLYDENENNEQTPIICNFKTKVFDFGESSVRKNLSKINLQLGNNGGAPIKVELITECGNEEMEITLDGTDTDSRSAEYIESKALFPCMCQVIKMGLMLSCEGTMAIDGMSFKYRTTGGAR